jgi:hypothetical protein
MPPGPDCGKVADLAGMLAAEPQAGHLVVGPEGASTNTRLRRTSRRTRQA